MNEKILDLISTIKMLARQLSEQCGKKGIKIEIDVNAAVDSCKVKITESF